MSWQTPPSELFDRLAQWILSAVAGALVVLVTFRTRLALIDRELELRKAEILAHKGVTEAIIRDARQDSARVSLELENRIMERLNAIDRRLSFTLEMVADIARKSGADQRFSDRILKFLADETGEPR